MAITPEAAAVDPLPIIDAHAHFWDLESHYYPWLCDPELIPFRYGDYSAVRRTYLPVDYRRDSKDFTIVGMVHVEAEHDPTDPVGETRWLERIAERTGLPSACVCQAWLDRADVAEVLAAQAMFPLVRGIRQKPKAATDPRDVRRGAPGSMDDPAWRRGFAMLVRYRMSFDLQTPYWHLDAAAELAADFPETQIIINHAGLPADRSEDGLRVWRKALDGMAVHGNVALKISGIGVPGRPWNVRQNRAIVRDAIAIFGTERCLFASNFPVDSLVADFRTIFSGYREITSDSPDDETAKLFHDNATRTYRLNGGRPEERK
ncbi:MAG: amidohydrolase family protein [Alphaproteobacteria bacterium]